jgi:hypothetical protein
LLLLPLLLRARSAAGDRIEDLFFPPVVLGLLLDGSSP